MAAFGRPGVYVTERLLPSSITGTTATNAAGAIVGKFAQGPTAVTLVTSWYEFSRTFGGYDIAYPATFGVGLFFKNGGTELYVRRVLNSSATAAATTINNTSNAALGTVTPLAKGADSNKLRIQFTCRDASPTTSSYWDLAVYKEAGTDSASTADDILLEQFPNVLLGSTTSKDYIVSVVQAESQYISIAISDATKFPVTTVIPLTGSSDGTAVLVADFQTAVNDFASVERPLVLFAPEVMRDMGSTDGATIQGYLLAFAEANAGFAVLDTAADFSVSQATTYASGLATSSYAAVYYPNIYIADPLGRNSTSVRKAGPAGAVAGLYLTTDRDYGPFKSPAGLQYTVGGAVALERRFTSAELDTLNSAAKPVNAIRDIPGAGVVVMGARTLKQDGTANRYISMRRSLNYLKKELTQLTQFALFQNNDERLWSQIRATVSVFLNDYRNRGGLAGGSPDEAFYVKCDAENNPDTSVAQGVVNIEVGVSLEYPAEFISITLSQKTAN
jgi:phage tail sheath protein FI